LIDLAGDRLLDHLARKVTGARFGMQIFRTALFLPAQNATMTRRSLARRRMFRASSGSAM